jgi:hypothetical protein
MNRLSSTVLAWKYGKFPNNLMYFTSTLLDAAPHPTPKPKGNMVNPSGLLR